MACAPFLRDELSCSICLNIFTDPVTLRCGHNFCRVCIGQLLDKQQETRLYSCPECRMEFVERPALQRNINLFNIVEGFRPTQPDENDTGVFCTYCVDSPEPAVRSCLLCEASLCDKHLRFHSKSPEHVLMDPSASLENRKCPVHKKILEYYCTQDSVCICVSCSLAGEHEGHKAELLDVASEKKKIELKGVLNNLTSEREETERRVLHLKDHRTKIRLETEVYIKNFTVLIKEFREKLNTIEETVPNMISAQEKKLALSVSGFIKQLEMKKGELSTKISTFEELCSMSDPIMFFKHQLVCDSDQEHSSEVVDDVHQVGDLDLALVSALLHTAIDKFTTEAVCSGFDIPHISPITLDVSTAGNDVAISEDLKMASWVGMGQCYLQTPERFQSCQVLSLDSFSSGKHYWVVGTSDLGDYCVGVCNAGIDRKGEQSIIGENDKSWGLRLWDNQYSAIHNTMVTPLPSRDTSRKLGLYLDYEAGQLSFYELQVPMRHLHTFTVTFTEPLHVLCWVMGSWVTFNYRDGKNQPN